MDPNAISPVAAVSTVRRLNQGTHLTVRPHVHLSAVVADLRTGAPLGAERLPEARDCGSHRPSGNVALAEVAAGATLNPLLVVVEPAHGAESRAAFATGVRWRSRRAVPHCAQREFPPFRECESDLEPTNLAGARGRGAANPAPALGSRWSGGCANGGDFNAQDTGSRARDANAEAFVSHHQLDASRSKDANTCVRAHPASHPLNRHRHADRCESPRDSLAVSCLHYAMESRTEAPASAPDVPRRGKAPLLKTRVPPRALSCG